MGDWLVRFASGSRKASVGTEEVTCLRSEGAEADRFREEVRSVVPARRSKAPVSVRTDAQT